MVDPVKPGVVAAQKKAFDPIGKSFSQCIDAFVADAKATHGVTVRKNSSSRTAQWQQKYHVAHMFAFNKYKSTKPNKTETGKRTIAWSYISDAKTSWHTIKFSDILRTKNGKVPVKAASGWAKNSSPDKEKSLAHAKDILRKAGIGGGGTAMVSSGLKPCKSPCACRAGRSKHISGVAVDFNMVDLNAISGKLTVAKAGSLDEYLEKFGLHRPLKDHASSPEKWHIERKS